MTHLKELLKWLSRRIDLNLECMYKADVQKDENLRRNFNHEISTLREVYDHIIRYMVETEEKESEVK